MAVTIEATYENGVFVPARRPALADRQRVRLTIEPVIATTGAGPPPSVGPARGRIRIDLALAREIASSPVFHPSTR